MMATLSSFLADLSNHLGLAWWVEIKTLSPICTYFFGPFLIRKEAEAALFGYVEDLEAEQAQNIVAHIQRCHPPHLTICNEMEYSC
ncbi:DUF1816 domain-containing protein [Acaryochloris sp. CCMEE 5410]|uniref:DUF1816 domain-containing protein n=1 Tax=Acaryochloris sp. CCMEE 5410 TaxID=310037 RepID=UPI0002485093|nr:DUF1816 domain-containing protein [Acaryochloris sp. CCMEE 5410]KAI9129252.1 DUF1816 domain-containing protein [Acaryochloris sp. CCMEE 5410]